MNLSLLVEHQFLFSFLTSFMLLEVDAFHAIRYHMSILTDDQ